jgi:hypothetical protein
MSKQTVTPVVTDAMPAKLPDTITLFGNGGTVWNELMVHVRNGYIIAPGTFPVVFPDANVSVALCLGTPNQLIIQAAEASVVRALREEQDRFDQRVKYAAKLLVEQQAEADLEQRLAEAEATAEAAIAKIRKDAAAERARLAAK